VRGLNYAAKTKAQFIVTDWEIKLAIVDFIPQQEAMNLQRWATESFF
jgi:hypothetical protein